MNVPDMRGAGPVDPTAPPGRPVDVSPGERTAAILAHSSAIIAMILSAGSLSLVGPLILWLIYKDRSSYVRQAAAGSFNFNLWAWVMAIAGWVCFFTIILIPVAVVLWTVAGIMTLWCHIHGAMRASRDETYRYPASITILS